MTKGQLKRSSQLPDNEGLVFITYVPDAPFQILGRRGLDGELYAGQFYLPKEGSGWRDLLSAVQDLGGVEIVTGSEAETLIRAVIAERERFNN